MMNHHDCLVQALISSADRARGPGDLGVSNFHASLLRTDLDALIGWLCLGAIIGSRGCIGPW